MSLTFNEDEPINITLSAYDPDGDGLTYEIRSYPDFGELDGTKGFRTYTPRANFADKDTFTFVVRDDKGRTSRTATVTLVGTAVNDAPVANDATVTPTSNSPLNIVLTGSDVENSKLTYILLDRPSRGTLTYTGPADTMVGDVITHQTPAFTYVSNANYFEEDSLTFKVIDKVKNDADVEVDGVESNVATITIGSLLDAPVGNDFTIGLNQFGSIDIDLGAAEKAETNATYSVKQVPVRGSLSATEGRYLTYTNTKGDLNIDSFTYLLTRENFTPVEVTVSIVINPPTPSAPLNDTGITFSGNPDEGNNSNCVGELVEQQDCSMGRDNTEGDSSNGVAGFSFTKLDSLGRAIPATSTLWSCVRDNTTGLTWEVTSRVSATAAEVARKPDDTFTWYDTDPNTNGGANGYDNAGENTCADYDAANSGRYCNTKNFADRTNTTGLCGIADWRLPTVAELRTLVNLGTTNPALDTVFFPYVRKGAYWTGSPLASDSDNAWYVDFYSGFSYAGDSRSKDHYARLVHSD